MFDEDFSVFFDADEFATHLTFTGGGLTDPVSFAGIWDSPFSDPVEIHSVDVYINCRSSDAEKISEGARITHRGKNYRVMATPEADGTGVSIIRLELL